METHQQVRTFCETVLFFKEYKQHMKQKIIKKKKLHTELQI